ncbi:ATP-binding cassette domain-containing protein [Candidatus Saccharibacteria bacterium]|nr:ATP-binding cassette domain-containing protein [Candidatus Saccharibacteria bacterium]
MVRSSTPVIELRGLTKQYGLGDAAQNALDNVDLRVEKGEFIVIMGPSGCGKTTLLNIMGLLDRADSGEYFLDGTSVATLSKRQHARIRSRQIGIVFQSFNLINRLTVLENVALPLSYRGGMRRVKRLEQASAVLKNFHLQEREYYMPWQLSGGQVQRVAIARALVNHPSIILADEPTGNLDSRSSHIIMEELAQLHRRGNTIIMVTHNPNLTSYASRVIKMLDGQIASDEQMRTTAATPTPVARKPRVRRAAPAGKAAPTIAQGTAAAAQPAAPVKAIARGRPAKAPAPATTAPTVVDYEDPHTQDGPTIEPMPVAPPEVPPALPAAQQTTSATPAQSQSAAMQPQLAAPQPTNQPAAPVAHTAAQSSSTPSAVSTAQPAVATPAQQPTLPSSAHQSSTKEPQA